MQYLRRSSIARGRPNPYGSQRLNGGHTATRTKICILSLHRSQCSSYSSSSSLPSQLPSSSSPSPKALLSTSYPNFSNATAIPSLLAVPAETPPIEVAGSKMGAIHLEMTRCTSCTVMSCMTGRQNWATSRGRGRNEPWYEPKRRDRKKLKVLEGLGC